MLAMADPAKKRASYDDVLAAPEHHVAEILNGELVLRPRPAPPHAVACSILGAELIGPFFIGRNGPGGWVILFEPELHLNDDVLVPDVAAWRRERMPEIPDVAGIKLPPDWICEVLSPSTQARDRADKLPIYAREGIEHVWLVDPLEGLRLDEETYRLKGRWRDEARVRLAPFDSIELELATLWMR